MRKYVKKKKERKMCFLSQKCLNASIERKNLANNGRSTRERERDNLDDNYDYKDKNSVHEQKLTDLPYSQTKN